MQHPRTSPTRHPDFAYRTSRNRVWLAYRSLPTALAIFYVLDWTIVTAVRNITSPATTGAHLRGFVDGWRQRLGPRLPISWGTVIELASRGRPPVI